MGGIGGGIGFHYLLFPSFLYLMTGLVTKGVSFMIKPIDKRCIYKVNSNANNNKSNWRMIGGLSIKPCIVEWVNRVWILLIITLF